MRSRRTSLCTIGLWIAIFTVVPPQHAVAEQTGPARRVLAADYHRKQAAIVDEDGTVVWRYPIQDIHDIWMLPNGNVLLQTTWTDLAEVTSEGKVVWKYDAATSAGNAGKKVEVHAFQPLEGERVMIVESGPRRILEVDRKGSVLVNVSLKVDHPSPHRDTRQARKLPNGNYLVAHEGDQHAREYDEQGKIVWEYNVGTRLYSAVRTPDGTTLIGTGDGHRVIEVDHDGEIVWSVTQHELPDVELAWVTMVERLENGNTRFVNCHAGPNNPQFVEVTPDKRVVWTFRDFETFGNSMPVARVLP